MRYFVQIGREFPPSGLGEFVHNNTKPLFRTAGHFWTNTKYSGEVSLIISVDIHRELTDSVSELEYFLSVKNIEITLYAQARQSQPSTFNPRQYLQSLEIPKQISYVLTGMKWATVFRENWSKFLTAGYLVFWKQFPAAGYLDTAFDNKLLYLNDFM